VGAGRVSLSALDYPDLGKKVTIMAGTDSDLQPSPAELLGRIQAQFMQLGIFGQTLTLIYKNEKYLVNCETQSFAVHRLVEQCHVPPGRPGWPVCLVTEEIVVDETSPPHLPEDEFASGLSLERWLDLINSLYTPT
jgi:hypothetical protein